MARARKSSTPATEAPASVAPQATVKTSVTLAEIVAASNVEPFYLFVSLTPDVLEMEKAGLVEHNPSMPDPNDPTAFATRATEQGKEKIMNDQTATEQTTTEQTQGAEGAGSNVVKHVGGFAIMKVAIPTPKRASEYPFDELPAPLNGEAFGFFVPATTDRPDPWKTLASTVSSASARYRDEVGKETRTVKGEKKEVAKFEYSRKFAVNKGEQNGVVGAWITRIQ